MSNMETNAEKAKKDKKRVARKKKKIKNHDETKMYGVCVHSPHVLKAKYFTSTPERLQKTIRKLRLKALDLNPPEILKYDIINPYRMCQFTNYTGMGKLQRL